jgi:predicted TIM-barrel fold metal-dependent hydrolase
LASGINKWIAGEWLDSDPRFRASIVVAPESPELAAKEIEACAADRRFVQVLLLSMAEMPLGRRFYWPIYDAAAKHGLPVAIHAGSALRHAPSASGWPSYLVEDYVNYAEAFQTQILSLITEGVCTRHPNLKFVLTESGFSWLPAFMWRANKSWRALRVETPWVKRAPAEIMRSNFRFTLHPADLPPEPEMLERFIEQMGSDEMLLFSSDYPHWHFDGDQAIPASLPSSLVAKICHDNPLSTYPRLKEDFE